MTITAESLMTLGGTILALDQRIADALADYARQAAADEGLPAQTWCRKRWACSDYEAKNVLKGLASKATYERILKMRGSHRGWFVGLAVTGAVVGQPIHEFLREQTRLAAKAAEHAEEHERLAQAAYRRLADHAAHPRESGRSWRRSGALGAEAPRRVAGNQD